MQMGKVLTIKNIAERWDCDRRTVEAEIKKGNLKYYTFGSEKRPQYRIREEWVIEFENRGGSQCLKKENQPNQL